MAAAASTSGSTGLSQPEQAEEKAEAPGARMRSVDPRLSTARFLVAEVTALQNKRGFLSTRARDSVLSLSAVQVAPLEWIMESEAGQCCDDPNCSKNQAAALGMAREGAGVADAEAFAVQAVLCGQAGSSYEDPIRVRIATGSSYGDQQTWPKVYVLDSIHHVAVDGSSGAINPVMFELFTDSQAWGHLPVGTVASVLTILTEMLTDQAPEDVFGPRDPRSQVSDQAHRPVSAALFPWHLDTLIP